ncbi:MAG: NAD(P)-dependent oxidoreductase [Candidatus Omnitrophica bacterium]|nr:NAD(P)-dependent oxidoreductase [Candidatus Omnitrophota bacterium]
MENGIKKILITGANGFVGRTVYDKCLALGWNVIPVVRKPGYFSNEIVVDFAGPCFYEEIWSFPHVDAVVHLAANIGWDGSSRESFFRPNVLATTALADWARESNAYFVFSSTAIVCGVGSKFIDDESKPNPDTDYGFSKWLAEEVINMSGVECAVLRISGVFGRCGPGHLGINRSILDASKGLSPVMTGSGAIRRNYIYVKDLADIIIYCVKNRILGTHLVGGSKSNTVLEMLQTIRDTFSLRDEINCRPGKEGHDQMVKVSSTLPAGRLFEDAIRDINEDEHKAHI